MKDTGCCANNLWIDHCVDNLLIEAYGILLKGIVPGQPATDEDAVDILIDRSANVVLSMVERGELTLAESINICTAAAERIAKMGEMATGSN